MEHGAKMEASTLKHLSKILHEGSSIAHVGPNIGDAIAWSKKAAIFLKTAVGDDIEREFHRCEVGMEEIWDQHSARLGYLQGIIAKSEAERSGIERSMAAIAHPAAAAGAVPSQNPKKVFIVHGHDDESKESVARFIERLRLEPIILHEKPNSGRTIIEKFEAYSADIAYAVVLLTPDDVGSVVGSHDSMKSRARQNVIMELGYFMGRLGRMRVCALYKQGVELPSDYHGVMYIEIDPNGAWRAKIAQEFVEAKLPIELSALLG
jgi:predicted nucleotide-binding protein